MSVRDFSDANIAIFQMTSAGAAYTLTLPFLPESLEWWNFTKYASNDKNVSGIWISGMPNNDALIIARGTSTLSTTQESTNGVSGVTDNSGWSATQLVPTAITAASPAVVTVNGNGLVNDQFVRATNFVSVPTSDATGMYILNNQLFQVKNVTTNTFQLFYPYSNVPFSTVGQDAFVNNGVAQFNLVGESLYTQNPAPVYQVTLGSAIMGLSGDVIYVRAMLSNQYTALGTLS